jgi:rSAM/selenodomain-associated transferase 1
MRRALVIVGKAPRAGVAKTRLVPPLSADEAAALYRAFLLDTVDLGLRLGWECVTLVHPAGADQRGALRQLLPTDVRLAVQSGQGLGNALAGAFRTHFEAGFAPVVLVASDSPGLPSHIMHAASAALVDHDMAIGPTLDGGYYLIGLKRPCPAVFEGIEWSTPRVLEQTVAAAYANKLGVYRLPEWFDVDGPEDLTRLQTVLAESSADVAANTRRALAQLTLDRVGDVVRS